MDRFKRVNRYKSVEDVEKGRYKLEKSINLLCKGNA